MINIIVFTNYKDTDCKEEMQFDMNTIIAELQRVIKFEPAAYLSKLKDQNKLAWVFQTGFGNNDSYFGNMDSKFYKKLSERYYKKW